MPTCALTVVPRVRFGSYPSIDPCMDDLQQPHRDFCFGANEGADAGRCIALGAKPADAFIFTRLDTSVQVVWMQLVDPVNRSAGQGENILELSERYMSRAESKHHGSPVCVS